MPHRAAHHATEQSLPLTGGGVSEALLRKAFDRSVLPRLGWTFQHAIENTAIRISLNNTAEAMLKPKKGRA